LRSLTEIFTELSESNIDFMLEIANSKGNHNHYDPLTTPIKLST